jgi:hypothetical protein
MDASNGVKTLVKSQIQPKEMDADLSLNLTGEQNSIHKLNQREK